MSVHISVGAVFKTQYMLMNLSLVMVKHLGKSRTTVCHRKTF